jgi:hypothetical protein
MNFATIVQALTPSSVERKFGAANLRLDLFDKLLPLTKQRFKVRNLHI